MILLALFSAITAAGVALAILLLAYGRPEDDRGGARAEMVRYFGMAAFAALLCGAMNALETAGGGVAAAASGNATNVMSVGLLWAGARHLNHRRAVGAIGIAAVGIFLLGLTFLIPLENATLLKTAGLGVFAVMGALECARRPLGDLRGSRLLAWTLGLYAAYNLTRLIVVAVVGTAPLLEPGPISAEATALVSAVTIALVSIGTVRVGRQLDDRPSPGTRAHDRGVLRRETARLIGAHGSARITLVQLPELDLIRTAHSVAHGREMLRAAAGAVDDALPEVVTGLPGRDTVFAVSPVSVETDWIESAVRRAFARRMPSLDCVDVPDLLFEHRVIRSVDPLSSLMRTARQRVSRADR
ncbi:MULTISPECIES: hypothetical protein [Microbacterium]|uniref:hypothetical protein n=1 Tax=Microbacterium TaxID=33882 RepID=UPI002786937D|nr:MULTISPECIES: hypothetical protein [Microbacterium]MDQ1082957.1 hypothetical protein [Microbacterium sp. SORGH_AS_0344]MDQ1168275.1 hypothetical protein [Microbacterium proteolyticum]